MSEFQVRSKRSKGWFFMDNDFIDRGFAGKMGAVGTGIYMTLCRYADPSSQECFPSQRTIAKRLGISVRTVQRYLGIFEKHRLLQRKKQKDERTRRQLTDLYILLDKSQWELEPDDTVSYGESLESDAPGDTESHGSRATHVSDPDDTSDQIPHDTESHRKEDIGLRNTSKKDARASRAEDDTGENQTSSGGKRDYIAETIKAFEFVNPACKKHYGNKTQRGAVERLLQIFIDKVAEERSVPNYRHEQTANGSVRPIRMTFDEYESHLKDEAFEQLEQVIALVAKTNGRKFAPTITTPLQMEDKFAQLKSYIEKLKDEQQNHGKGKKIVGLENVMT